MAAFIAEHRLTGWYWRVLTPGRVTPGDALELESAADSFTLADIPCSIQAYRWYWFDIERPDLPNLKAWYDRLTERPSYREVVMNPLV